MKRLEAWPMRRRDFIAGLGGAAAWPLAAWAQQPALPVVGYLNSGSGENARFLAAFRQGLKEAGYVERENVSIEYRFAQNQYDRLSALAADLVRRQVAVIAATGGPPPALAAKAATATIPIVFNMGVDPVALGLVASLNRPGGNLTGVSSLNVELGQKRLELLHELVPTATTVALLLNPTNASVAERLSRDLQAAARTLGLQLHVLHASTEPDFDAAFATSVQLRAGALVIGTDGFLITRTAQLASLALRYAMPTMFQFREFAAAGGLMSYGGRVTDEYHLVGSYAGRILKGEKPGDLPVQQSTRIELIINMKTAKALGLTVPQSILLRADEVIE
jgi:putative tryptophan/tyrosine transport system substrate-binding protein